MLDTPSEFMDLVKQGPTRTSFKCRLQDEARPPESQRHDANSATSSALAALEHKPKIDWKPRAHQFLSPVP